MLRAQRESACLHNTPPIMLLLISSITHNPSLTLTRSGQTIMLTCIARPNQPEEQEEEEEEIHPPNQSNPSLKSLTSQIKDIALKATGVYRNCSPCTGSLTDQQPHKECADSSDSTSSTASYRRTTSSNSTSTASSRQWGKQMEARLKGISSSSSSSGGGGGGRTPVSASGRRDDPVVVFVEESEPKQWVAQVEPGVLITFVSMPRGGNDLKRICFSREMFNKWQAQRWWAENYEKVMELYNVHRLNRQAFPLPTTSRIEDESSKLAESCEDCRLVTPPLSKERLPRSMMKPKGTGLTGYSSSDYDSHHHASTSPKHYSSSNTTTNGAKIESSTSMDASVRTSSSREADDSGELSVSNGSDIVEKEWVEQDESGVYITIRALPGGGKELRRIRFSREKFGEMHARLWWEENRARIHKQYL